MERVLFVQRALPALGPDAAHEAETYSEWVQERERRRSRRASRFRRSGTGRNPALHLVMPTLEADLSLVELSLRGLLAQTSHHWTLSIVVGGEERMAEIGDLLDRVVTRRRRHRIRTLHSGASDAADQVWVGLEARRSAPIALMVPGDVWALDALALLTASLAPEGVVYADDDVLETDGSYRSPRFKPDYSPDLLLSMAYTGAPFAAGAKVADRLPHPIAPSVDAIEHELALAACELADDVDHITEVLCHRSPHQGSGLRNFGGDDYIGAELARRNDHGEVSAGLAPGTYRIRRGVPANATVSIIVPFRDGPQLLRTCVDSVSTTTSSDSVEFVLIDNGSSDPEILTLLDQLAARSDVHVIRDPRPFNWAALNNAAVDRARGDILLFLNNDIEALQDGWLPALSGHACRPDVGAVGARLVYPDRRLQHCGVVVGLIGAAGHPLNGLEDGSGGYMNMALVTRECSAVTGACLATRREVFTALGGFDESLGVDLNDVDYCLRGSVAGYRTIYEPGAELIHYESPSRGTAGGASDIMKFVARWKDYIASGDPYLNKNLTRSNVSCGLATPQEKERWNQWYSTLSAQ